MSLREGYTKMIEFNNKLETIAKNFNAMKKIVQDCINK